MTKKGTPKAAKVRPILKNNDGNVWRLTAPRGYYLTLRSVHYYLGGGMFVEVEANE